MLSIERLHPGDIGRRAKYTIVSTGERDHAVVAIIDGLRPTACVLRFLKGSHLQPLDYQLAIKTMAEIDEGENVNAG